MPNRIKSYTSVWRVDKVIYAINDLKLPFPVTFFQMGCFSTLLLLTIVFQKVPPLSLIEQDLVKYIAIPVAGTIFLSKKTFDGKKPLNFLKTVVLYLLRPKVTYGGKPVTFKKQVVQMEIAISKTQEKLKSTYDFYEYTEAVKYPVLPKTVRQPILPETEKLPELSTQTISTGKLPECGFLGTLRGEEVNEVSDKIY